LPILTFHALDCAGDVGALAPEVFRQGIACLHERGFCTLALADAAAMLRRGADLPPRSLVLTFDDGYRSVYTEALPVLQRYGMTATVFVTVGAPDDAGARDRLPSLLGREMLRWDEIREMSRAGIAIGAHSLTHADLSRLPPDRVETEVCRSRSIIEDRLGSAVPGFAYPYGRYDPQSYAVVGRQFEFACSDVFALASHASDPWALERIDTFYFRGQRRFGLIGSRWLPIMVQAIAVPRRLRRRATSACRPQPARTDHAPG
jgi:peptidoglycan/xylan/chitin deacetylase (PgdA/CDA1 family)